MRSSAVAKPVPAPHWPVGWGRWPQRAIRSIRSTVASGGSL